VYVVFNGSNMASGIRDAKIDFYPKVIKGSQNFEIRSRDPCNAHLVVVLWSGRSRGPSSMSVSNLKQISLFVQNL